MYKIKFLHNKLSKLFFVFVFLTTMSMYPKAQEVIPDSGITISPVIFEFEAEPGESIEIDTNNLDQTQTRIKYYNSTGQDKTIYLSTANFEPLDETGTPYFKEDDINTPYSSDFKSWITLETYKIFVKHLKPTEAIPTIVKYRIDVPHDAEPGSYYAGILQSLKSPEEEAQTRLDGSGAVTNPKSAALILLTVKGDVTKQGLIESFYPYDPYKHDGSLFKLFGMQILEYPPTKFAARIKNEGNAHFRPVGNIFIYRGNKQIDSIKFNASKGNVLRESTRRFDAGPWGENRFFYREPVLDEQGRPILKNKKGDLKTRLKINWDRVFFFPIGKYKAKLVAVYDVEGNKEIMEQTTVFWIIPWKLILLITITIGLYIAYKKYQNQKKEEKIEKKIRKKYTNKQTVKK